MTGLHVTLTDPEEPLTVIYDGPAAEAHQRLIPGVYFGSSLEERSWALHVTASGLTVEAVEDHPDDSACPSTYFNRPSPLSRSGLA